MENPNTWKLVEHVIAQAINSHHDLNQSGIYGLSLPRVIADALRTNNLLKVKAEIKFIPLEK